MIIDKNEPKCYAIVPLLTIGFLCGCVYTAICIQNKKRNNLRKF